MTDTAADPSAEGLTALLDSLRDVDEEDTVDLGELLDTFDSRAYAPFLWVPGLVTVSPIGAIPGMSIVAGLWILLVASQMLIGQSTPWVPRRLRHIEFDHDRLVESIDRVEPVAGWFDRYLKPRWHPLVSDVGRWCMAAACAGLAVSMGPLALVPMGVFVPGLTVTLFATSLFLGDGVLAACGWMLAIASAALTGWFFTG